jgi:integrase
MEVHLSRKGKNEGSIRKRKDGRWEGRYTTGYLANGKPDRKSVYGSTRTEAAKKLAEAIRNHQRGLPPVDERMTTGKYLDYYLETIAKPSVRPSTYQRYRQIADQHIIPKLGRIRLSQLTPAHVQGLLSDRLATGLSPRTVQQIQAVLRAALNHALKWELVARNSATLVTPPRIARKEISPFTPEEARDFLIAIRGDRLEALYTVALAVGLRRGEALGLRWEDIDFEKKYITVSHALQRIGGTLRLVEPKSASSRRTIPLPPFAVEAMLAHWKNQVTEKTAAGSNWREHGLVFTTKRGTPLDPDNVTKYFKRVLKKADSRDQRFHDLRHCCASLLVAQAVNPRTVMEILGHSQISLTMNTYAHVFLESKKQALDQLDTVLGLSARVEESADSTTDSTPVGVNPGVIEVDLVAGTHHTKVKTPAVAGASDMRPEGFEPSTLGLRVPCSTN